MRIIRNVIIYIDISIRRCGRIFDIVVYRCLIFFLCYLDPAESFSDIFRSNLHPNSHIQTSGFWMLAQLFVITSGLYLKGWIKVQVEE